MNNDLSLLRPFDLEAAKAGAPIIWAPNTDCVFLGESINKPNLGTHYRIEHRGGLSYASACDLRMAPLCWVEGRPVYPGDRVWWKLYNEWVVVRESRLPHILNGDGHEEDLYLHVTDCTWTPPTVKREGFCILHQLSVYESFEQAEARMKRDYTGDCFVAKCEWEEPGA